MTRVYMTAAAAASFFVFGAFSAPSFADESVLPGTFTGNVAVTSEYSFRGIAQSDEHPALQAGIDWTHDSGLYLGTWGSNVDFNDGDEASLEMDVYGGLTGHFTEKTGWDLGFIYYAYPGADDSLNYDFLEAKAALTHDFGPLAATASVNYSPDYFASSGDAFYYSLNATAPLPHDFSLLGHVAYQTIDDEAAFGVPDYMDWSAGIAYTLDKFNFSLNYLDTDLNEPTECRDGCAERVIFTVKYSL